MTTSEIFFKRAKNAIKQNESQNESQLAARIRDILLTFLQELPVSLQHDIFNFYYQKFLQEKDKNIYQLAEMPLQLINFIKGQGEFDPMSFSEEEWEMIREGINACAESMDLKLLNRLISTLIENKRY